MADKKLMTDVEVWDALQAARDALGTATGETVRGATALKTAREALTLIQMGHLASMDKDTDRNEAIKARGDS